MANYMGEFYAVICALLWAVSVIFLRRAGFKTHPLAINLFRVSFSAALFLITCALQRVIWWDLFSLQDAFLLLISSVFGIVVSDNLFQISLNRVGASNIAIVDFFYAPSSVFLAWMLLGETLSIKQLLGMTLIMFAVLILALYEKSQNKDPKKSSLKDFNFIFGIIYGLASMFIVAVGAIALKPILAKGAPVLWLTAFRQIIAAVALASVSVCLPNRKQIFAVFKPQKSWKDIIPATILSSYIALLVWIASIKYTKVSVASILHQSNSIFVILLAIFFLKEKLTAAKIVALLVAFAGIFLVLF